MRSSKRLAPRSGLFAMLISIATAGGGLASDAAATPHPAAAMDLLSGVEPYNTTYKHGDPDVSWEGSGHSLADCSGFVDELLKHTCRYDAAEFKKWFDSHRPSARRCHDGIVARTGFSEVASLAAVRPGDFLALEYLERTDNTGHIMRVAEASRRMAAKEPIVAGTERWEVTVIDSSMSGHGTTDTRHGRGPGGRDHEGLGEGVLRLYAGADGTIAAFAWSTESVPKFESPDSEHLVVGRLVPGFRPRNAPR